MILSSRAILTTIGIALFAGIAALIELFSESQIRFYILSILVSLLSVMLSWLFGGKKASLYVLFFLVIVIGLFTRQLWIYGTITTAQLFIAKSFFVIYALSLVIFLIIARIESPADRESRLQKIENERTQQSKKDLEYIIANSKMRNDLLGEANRAKDDLQYLETSWKSFLHDVKGDLTTNQQEEIQNKVISPFSRKIISHLESLEHQLEFKPKEATLSEIYEFIKIRFAEKKKLNRSADLRLINQNWIPTSDRCCNIDLYKLWGILDNLINNSLAALELKKIEFLRNREGTGTTNKEITLSFSTKDDHEAAISIEDHAGGLTEENLTRLFETPLLSAKRNYKKTGQGTIFVKFFAEKMGIRILKTNIGNEADKGLSVTLMLPTQRCKK